MKLAVGLVTFIILSSSAFAQNKSMGQDQIIPDGGDQVISQIRSPSGYVLATVIRSFSQSRYRQDIVRLESLLSNKQCQNLLGSNSVGVVGLSYSGGAILSYPRFYTNKDGNEEVIFQFTNYKDRNVVDTHVRSLENGLCYYADNGLGG